MFIVSNSNCYASAIVLDDKYVQYIEKKYGDYPARRMRAWKKLLQDTSPGGEEKQKIIKVNDFFNQFQYISDINYKGVPDYWMTPNEFVVAGGGDCEDFSIAKYFTLVKLGINSTKLRITYVKALEYNQAHMVLAYYPTPTSEPLILDNLSSKVLTASKRQDLKPIYSFNGEGIWLAKQRGQSTLVGKSSNLSKWQKVIKRMQHEGELK